VTIRVVIVDDSATIRLALTRMLAADPEIQIVGSYGAPHVALDEIPQLRPDVVTTDVHMPGMDGITFVRDLMRIYPCPVVMVSTDTRRGSSITFDALDAGAVDFVAKPVDAAQLSELADTLAFKLKAAARARVGALAVEPVTGLVQAPARTPIESMTARQPVVDLIAIGGSMGAPQVLPELLKRLPVTSPCILVALHMPGGFTLSYAERLAASLPGMVVREARRTNELRRGHVLLAPGDFHLRVVRGGDGIRAITDQADPVNRHRPSIDILFDSCAHVVAGRAAGVLLSGMGSDGSRGLMRMRQAGAWTVVQDPASSLVGGMPEAAVEAGAAVEVLGIRRMAERVGLLTRGAFEARSTKG